MSQFLVFLFSLILFSAAAVTTDLPSTLSYVLVGSGDDVIFVASGPTTATFSGLSNDKILHMTGGKCIINGNGYVTTITSTATNNWYFADIYGPGTQLTVNKWVFSVSSNKVAVLYTQSSASQITVNECNFSGVARYFAFIKDSTQVVINKCTFQNSVAASETYSLFEAYAIFVESTTQFTITNSAFINFTSGSVVSGNIYTGYGATVYITTSNQVTLTNVSFQNCSGLLAGAILAKDTGTGNTYTNVSFIDNSFVISASDLTAIYGSSNPFFQNDFGGSAVLGNDISRFGTSITITDACSNSTAPHYRNGTTGVTADFPACPAAGNNGDDDDDAAFSLRTPFSSSSSSSFLAVLTVVVMFLLLFVN